MSLWILNHHRLTTWRLGRTLFEDRWTSASMPSAPRGLIVGACPGPNTDPRLPMFPHPQTSAAGRLMRCGGMTPQEYLGRLERVNQCEKVWSDLEARRRHLDIARWLLTQDQPPRVLLLGRDVQRIWDFGGHGFGGHGFGGHGFGYQRWGNIQITWAPHPSGMTRVYNDVEARRRLGRYVRWCAGLSTEKFDLHL